MDTTFYYEIPVIDKVLTINTPVFNDYAYFVLRSTKVEQWLFLCGQQPWLHLLLRFASSTPFWWKQPESEEYLLEHRTGDTDAFDTLYIGCEKFPQHDLYPIAIGGVR